MPNMSHCRFENTAGDLEDCQDALSEMVNLEGLSDSEQRAARRLIRTCRQIATDYGDLAADD